MPLFYCPFCLTEYELTPVKKGLEPVCKICGENLERKRLFKLSQLAALLLVFSFTTPLIFAFFQIIEGSKEVYQRHEDIVLRILDSENM